MKTEQLSTDDAEPTSTSKTPIIVVMELSDDSNGSSGLLQQQRPDDPDEVSTVTEIVVDFTPAADQPPKEPARPANETRRTFIICPRCFVKVPLETIGEHILSSHPGLVVVEVGPTEAEVEELIPEVEMLTPEESDSSLVDSGNPRVVVWNPSIAPQPHRTSAQNLAPASDACVPCTAPGCNKFVHQSNLPRHWRSRHPDLNRFNFPSGSKPKPKPTSFDRKSTTSTESVDQIIKVEVGEHVIDFRPNDVIDDLPDPVASNLQLVNGLYVCAFEGCDYSTKVNSNMWRHKRKFNHCGSESANRAF